jgi:hypothetical protein
MTPTTTKNILQLNRTTIFHTRQTFLNRHPTEAAEILVVADPNSTPLVADLRTVNHNSPTTILLPPTHTHDRAISIFPTLQKITMKVFLNYEDNENSDLHKSLKITLPKSWKNGPASNLLDQFVESYNAKFQDTNALDATQMHLCVRQQVPGGTDSTQTELAPVCSDAVVLEEIPDRGDVYICHGPSQTKAEQTEARKKAEAERQAALQNTVACTHFGCRSRFPRGGPYPTCRYHKLPPVFHETAKYWACCPNKKAYDWDDFQNIPGCQTGTCTDQKDDGQKLFLGGTDLREQANEGAPLKSIDDFNRSQQAGGADAAPVLDRLRKVMMEMGVETELYDQVVDGMKKEYEASCATEAELLAAVSQDLGGKLKAMMKSVAAEQLRIK